LGKRVDKMGRGIDKIFEYLDFESELLDRNQSYTDVSHQMLLNYVIISD
jgi:hypothetical protein